MKKVLPVDECVYFPGELITARHMGNRSELGLVLAVVTTGSLGTLPSYLILWEWRGLVEHEDGHLAAFGTGRA
jgi:hypothetical protein